MVYHFKIHKEPRGGYWAECVELQGCQTQGDSLDELQINMRDALDLFLSEPKDSDVIFPFPRAIKARRGIVEVAASPRVAFAALLKRERLKHHLTQRQAADKLGYKNIYAYQKLEIAKSANPGLDTIEKIKEILPGFPVHRIFS